MKFSKGLKVRKVFIVVGILLLASCSGTRSFDCKINDKGTCDSLSVVDKRISTQKKSANQSSGGYFDSNGLRVPEKTARVWVAPYVADDIYHEASFIRFVVKPSSWS